MSLGFTMLHSHSALERELKETANDKRHVLIDEQFKYLFNDDMTVPFVHNGKMYYKVPTLSFVMRGGVFRNLRE